jgi:hypothetical protein
MEQLLYEAGKKEKKKSKIKRRKKRTGWTKLNHSLELEWNQLYYVTQRYQNQ